MTTILYAFFREDSTSLLYGACSRTSPKEVPVWTVNAASLLQASFQQQQQLVLSRTVITGPDSR